MGLFEPKFEGRTLAQWATMVASQDAAAHTQALAAIPRMDPEWTAKMVLTAMEALQRLVTASEEREQPARAAIRAAGPAAVPVLLPYLESSDMLFGVSVALSETGAYGLPQLTAVLQDGRFGSQAHKAAVLSIGRMKPPRPQGADEWLDWVAHNESEGIEVRRLAAKQIDAAARDEVTAALADEQDADWQRITDEAAMLTPGGRYLYALQHNLPVVVRCSRCQQEALVARKGVRDQGVVVMDVSTVSKAARYCRACSAILCAGCAAWDELILMPSEEMRCPTCRGETILADLEDVLNSNATVERVVE